MTYHLPVHKVHFLCQNPTFCNDRVWPESGSALWFGSLDPDPHGGKKLDPDLDPHWNHCGSETLEETTACNLQAIVKDFLQALGRGGWPISHLGGWSILLSRCKGVACKPMWLLRLAHLCDVGEGREEWILCRNKWRLIRWWGGGGVGGVTPREQQACWKAKEMAWQCRPVAQSAFCGLDGY